MADLTEDSLDVPSHLFPRKVGLGLDIGGSLIKVAYAKEVDSETTRLCMKMFMKEEMEEALEFLAQECVPGLDIKQPIICCGLGAKQLMQTVANRLRHRLEVGLEVSLFTAGFAFLRAHMPHDRIHLPDSPKALSHIQGMLDETIVLQRQLSQKLGREVKLAPGERVGKGSDSSSPDREGEEEGEGANQEATALVIIGSGTGIVQVTRDGAAIPIEGMPCGGRTFLGLGSLLTGAESFSELTALAGEGDSGHVDELAGTLPRDRVGTGAGSRRLPAQCPLFAFGQAVYKKPADFSRADLAACCLTQVCRELAQFVHFTCLQLQLTSAHIAGGFPGLSATVRTELETQLLYRCMRTGCDVDYHFLRHGTSLGAIGALLVSLRTTH